MRSLEINWLRRFDRSLIVPQVVFAQQPRMANGLNCSGIYLHPGKYEYAIEGKFYDGWCGLLVIGTADPADIPALIAHEWRHHWQMHRGIEYDGVEWNDPRAATDIDAWEASTKRYFRRSRCEFDALRFEMQVAPTDIGDYRMSLATKREGL